MPVNASDLKAVLFDMGGTLFDYSNREMLRTPEHVALRRLGVDPDSAEARAASIAARAEVERRYASVPAFLHRDLFADRLSSTARILGKEPPPDVLSEYSSALRDAIVEALRPRPDARSTLQALRHRGYYVGVVSNADDDYLGEVLTRGSLVNLVDDWTSSEEAGSCKPDSGIFLSAAQKARCRPAQAVYVGDSPQHDIAGARAVGMSTVLIGRGVDAPLAGDLPGDWEADFRITELSQLLELAWCAPVAGTM